MGGGRGGGYISGLCPVLKQKVLQELKSFGNLSWIPFLYEASIDRCALAYEGIYGISVTTYANLSSV